MNPYLYVFEHCRHLIQGYIDFPTFHFFYMHKASLVGLSICIMGLTLIVAFTFLGMVASEFFCPNLQTIATSLHLSESVAGVTLLAFGNGSPDLMATFTAMQSNSGGLAIGELIGASAFITTLVLGGVAIIAPFKLTTSPGLLVRDAVFFLGALIFLGVVTYDGIMTALESFILIGYYFVYVMVVFVTTNKYTIQLLYKLKTFCGWSDNLAEHQYALLPDSTTPPPLEIEDDVVEQDHISEISYISTRSLRYGHFTTKKLSILDAVEYLDLYKHQALDELTRTPSPMHNIPRSIPSPLPFLMPPANTRTLTPKRPSYIAIPAFADLHPPATPLRRVSAQSFTTANSFPAISLNEPSDMMPELIIVENESESGDAYPTVMALLFPIITHVRTRRKNLVVTDLSGIVYILAMVLVSPFYCVLRLTVPVISSSSTSSFGTHVRHPVLCHVQNTLGSALATFIVLDGVEYPNLPRILCIPVGLILLCASLVLERLRPGTRHSAIWSWLGFIIGMLWIYIIANEVVTILKTVGAALKISEGMLGLTVFAIGNSVGDLIANLTMAKLGFPVMAVSACFASPMLNLVLGVGVSCAYLTMTSPVAKMELHVGLPIKIVNFGLVLVVILILAWLSVYKFYLGKAMGVGLIASYLVLISVALGFGVA